MTKVDFLFGGILYFLLLYGLFNSNFWWVSVSTGGFLILGWIGVVWHERRNRDSGWNESVKESPTVKLVENLMKRRGLEFRFRYNQTFTVSITSSGVGVSRILSSGRGEDINSAIEDAVQNLQSQNKKSK